MLIEDFSSGVLVFAAFACGIIALFGFMGNLLAVVSLLSSVKLRRSSTYFLVNLSVSNLPVCLLAMPTMAVCLIQAKLYNQVYVPIGFIFWIAIIGFICNQVELHTICVLGVNRVIAMYNPRFYQKLIQVNAYRWVLAVLWIYSILLWMPLAIGWAGTLEVSEKDLFVVISQSDKLTRRLYLFFAFTFPLLFSFVCHAMLLCKGLGLGGDAASRQQWRSHVTRTVMLVFLLLVVLSVPHIVVHTLHDRSVRIPKIWLLLHILFFTRYILDPAIFVLCSTEYREAFIVVLGALFPAVFTRETVGLMAPPCTPASTTRHKIIDISSLDLTKLNIKSPKAEKFLNDSLRRKDRE